MAILEVNNVKKVYTTRFGGNQVQALTDVSFSVEKGEYVAIMGESGPGKTTLLNILAALDRPTGGKVYLKGRDLGTVKEKEIAAYMGSQGLNITEEELAEQALLRAEYIESVRNNLRSTLSNVSIQEKDGSITPLTKKQKH